MTYSQLRSHLGISNKARLDTYLDRVYDCEVRCFGRPDITLILHPDGKLHGPFISRGRPARSRKVTPKDRKEYGRELRNVYACWGGRPHPHVQALLA
jgi:hypothetical protein